MYLFHRLLLCSGNSGQITYAQMDLHVVQITVFTKLSGTQTIKALYTILLLIFNFLT